LNEIIWLKKIKNGSVTYSLSCKKGDSYTLEAHIPRSIGAKKVYLETDNKNIEFDWVSAYKGLDVYSLNFEKIIPEGIPHFSFKISITNDAGVFSVKALNCLILKDMSRHDICNSRLENAPFIFTVKDDSDSFLVHGAIYHIFVDRFNKSNPSIRSDSRFNPDWENGIPEFPENNGDYFENNTHFGGNFKGIAEKLDYLKELSVDCIYLSPVSKAFSNHKYDVGSYKEIDENFGGENELKNLINKCHENGIKVIFDSVFNHTGDNSLYFNKFGLYNSIGAYQSVKSEYYHWYAFANHPDEYSSWWGIKCLPSIRKGCEDFMEYICGAGGVIDYYMSLGADGLRLDVADELTLAFIKKIKEAVKRNKENGIVIGEVWENAVRKRAYDEDKYYFDEGKIDSVTNYPLMNSIIEYIQTGDAQNLHLVISELYCDYPEDNALRLMNIISTHDTVRALSRFATPAKSNREKSVYKMNKSNYNFAVERIKNAISLQVLLPGIPCIYYGDEIGMEGLEDPFNRFPMSWHCVCENLLEWYKTILSIRKNNRPLSTGGIKVIYCKKGLFVFDRYNTDERIRIFVNQDDKTHRIRFKGKELIKNDTIEEVIIPPFQCRLVSF
jgi:glycosidase